jgi:hypothetical protein
VQPGAFKPAAGRTEQDAAAERAITDVQSWIEVDDDVE